MIKILADNNKFNQAYFLIWDTNAFCRRNLRCEKQKELLGLVASAVLRCDDCVKISLRGVLQRQELVHEEVMETLGIATLVGRKL